MKTYYVRFGSGDPRTNFGLSPTFLTFNNNGTAVTPPGISPVVGATGFYAFQYGTTTPIVFLIDGATTGLDSTVRYVTGAIDPADRSDEYGTTIVAQNTSLLASSSTLTAYSSTLVALGTNGSALGAANLAIGTSLTAFGVTSLAYSQTLTAIGTTITSYVSTFGSGTSQTADILNLIGTTLALIGNDSVDPSTLFGYLRRLQQFNEGNQTFNKVSGSWAISSKGGTLLATKTLSNSSTQVSKS